MGDSAGYLMVGALVGQAASSLLTAGAQSTSLRMQGQYQEQIYKLNSRLAELNAQDALDRGDLKIQQYGSAVKKLVGSQRASFAAQGIDVNSGSAKEVQNNTQYQARLSELTIRNNAFREAWGYKIEAITSSAKGEFTNISSNFNANTTMLSGYQGAANSLTKGGYWMAKSYGGGGGGSDSEGGAVVGDYTG